MLSLSEWEPGCTHPGAGAVREFLPAVTDMVHAVSNKAIIDIMTLPHIVVKGELSYGRRLNVQKIS